MSGNLQWIFQIIITVVMGIIAYFLKDMKKNTDDKINENRIELKKCKDENKSEINKVKEDLEDFKEKVADKYVMKEDFVRAMTTVDKRFDIVDEKLDKIYFAMCKKGSE